MYLNKTHFFKNNLYIYIHTKLKTNKIFPQRKPQYQMASLVNFTKYLGSIDSNCTQTLEMQRKLTISFCENSVTLVPNQTMKRNESLMNIHEISKLHFGNLKINQCSSYSQIQKKKPHDQLNRFSENMIKSRDLRTEAFTISLLNSHSASFQSHTSSMDISHTLQISFSISSSSSICCSSSSELVGIFRANHLQKHKVRDE